MGDSKFKPGQSGNPSTRFKPGQSGNPSGKPKLPKDVREAINLNRAEVTRSLTKLLLMPDEDLKNYFNDPKTTSLDRLLAKVIMEGIKKGDQPRADFIMNRLIGKVRDEVTIETKNVEETRAVLLAYFGKPENFELAQKLAEISLEPKKLDA